MIIDGAHNVASIEALVAAIGESFTARKKILVFATSQDKDIAGMMRLVLPLFDEIILTRYRLNPRGASQGAGGDRGAVDGAGLPGMLETGGCLECSPGQRGA